MFVFRNPKLTFTFRTDVARLTLERIMENGLCMTSKLKVIHVKVSYTESIV